MKVCPKCGCSTIKFDNVSDDEVAASRTYFFSSDKGLKVEYGECQDCHYFGSLFKEIEEKDIEANKTSLKKK